MKKSTFTLILFFSSVILYAQQNELMFHSLGSQHGLTYSAVRDILQDSKGYIWFTTNSGLTRYDGVDYKTYKSFYIQGLLTIRKNKKCYLNQPNKI